MSLMRIDQASAAELIGAHIHIGFARPGTIGEIVEEAHEGPPLTRADRVWIEQEIRRQMREKRRKEDTWPGETSWDRLNGAFKILRRKRILALHNAGVTQSEGLSLISEALEEQRSDGPLQGYCFYHQQDIQHAIERGRLLLSYGSVDATRETAGRIAALIVEALRKADLQATWSGDIDRRIEVNGFVWQKRSPRSTRSKKPRTT